MRQSFQRHALDGAVLFFHPPSGTSVRVQNAATEHECRGAPRVVMFGITNACNLRCDFCSRDAHAPSTWTVDSAATLLEGMAAAGTLEVAFGGGEPFAFRGFADLVERLFESTTLALHVTTNGTLIDASTMDRLAGKLGQVRLSIYDDTPWQPASRLLGAAMQKWGANVLVDAARLASLPALLVDLARAGASDVSILRYVEADATRQLDADGRIRLARIVEQSPLPARISVCFGESLAVPLLFDGLGPDGDCGAGLDFVSLTADGRLHACSFQNAGAPVRTAADVLGFWRSERAALSAASPRVGCARSEPRVPRAEVLSQLRIWQAFSGNNSGECILVATFATPEAASAVLAELIPGYTPGALYTEPWRELFAAERVASKAAGVAPDELMSVGRTLLARTDSALYDDFPELRALAWKRGAEVHPGFVHLHGDPHLLFVIRGHHADDARALVAAAPSDSASGVQHGPHVIGSVMLDFGEASLRESVESARAYAAGRPWACELVEDAVTNDTLLEVVKRLGTTPAARARLVVSFAGHDRDAVRADARELHEATEAVATRVEGTILFDPPRGKKRLAVLAHRRNATVTSLVGERVRVVMYFRPVTPAPRKGKRAEVVSFDVDALHTHLRERMPRSTVLAELVPQNHGAKVVVETDDPAGVMLAARTAAALQAAELTFALGDLDPLSAAVRRLRDEVDAQR